MFFWEGKWHSTIVQANISWIDEIFFFVECCALEIKIMCIFKFYLMELLPLPETTTEEIPYLFQNIWKIWCTLCDGILCTSRGPASKYWYTLSGECGPLYGRLLHGVMPQFPQNLPHSLKQQLEINKICRYSWK